MVAVVDDMKRIRYLHWRIRQRQASSEVNATAYRRRQLL